MQLRVEKWNGFPIRFVGSDDDWKAIGFDVAKALGYKRPNDALKLHVENKDKRLINLGSLLNQAETSKTGSTVKQRRTSKGGSPVMLVISEFGIYDLVFSSKNETSKRI